MGFPATDHFDDRSRILYRGTEESAVMEADYNPTHSGSSTKGTDIISYGTVLRFRIICTANLQFLKLKL